MAEQIPSLDFDRFEPVFDAEPAFFSEAREDNVQTLGWDALQARVEKCRACALHKTRTQVVFGCGNQKAGWLLAGEAPGYDEDIQGEPFVGRAGQLLNAMLRAIELKREDIYIANILKCRPPDNRNPEIAEMLSCGAYLERQISLVRPQLILATGSVSARHLLQTDTPIGRLRGTVYKYRDTGIPVVVMYHPAYLLRRPGEKAKAWQDLQLACRTAPVERNL
ncbi:MAG: uracil-DNA glycosylase [Gammaproteobacteria bacterium]|nr:uracil-DNA glycosylase [Gammaproteobacteria bacterium]